MDVQTVATPPAVAVGTQAPQPETQAAAAPRSSAISTPNSGANGPTIDGSPLPPQSGTISGAVAKLFGSGTGVPQPLNLNVSYRVDPHSQSIVTVFSDPQTGKEIAQFPAEILVGIAQFFDQHQGATLDHNA